MRFIDSTTRFVSWLLLALLVLLVACSAPMPEQQAPAAPASPAVVIRPVAPGGIPAPPAQPRSMAEVRLQAARRLVAFNPGGTYMGTVPDILLAIPVLEIELEADGRIRHIAVLRRPRQAQDTVQLAIDAVRRAAPFGNVSRLPRPWVFTETFLFDDDRKFKPRSLDQ